MSNPTTPFSWQMPENTDLVTNLPADFEVFGQAVATSMADLLGGTTGQILSKTTNTNMDFTWIDNQVGDITSITATTPLTGGGTGGDVTVGIQAGTTTQTGAIQLEDSTSSTSTTKAATPNSVKTSYDLANAAIAKSTVTTAGDIIYRNATVPTRLGIGTAGQVLKVNAGATAPEWGAAGNSALTLLSTTSFSGVSSVSLPANTFSATYDNYWMMLNITAGGAADAYISARLRASGTDNSTSNYGSGFFYVDFTSGYGNDTGGSGQTSFTKFEYCSANKYNYVTYMIRSPFATARTSYSGQSSGMTNEQHIPAGFFNATTSFDSMTIITSSTFTGSVSVYGISK